MSTARYCVPIPDAFIRWDDHLTLEEAFAISDGRPVIHLDFEVKLPYYAKITDQTGRTQTIVLTAPANPLAHRVAKGQCWAYFASTD
jgi:hypothetical protein